MVAAVLAAFVGRGYVGGHRLAGAALGLLPATSPRPAAAAAPPSPSYVRARESIAPRLSLVRTPTPTDTAPNPVDAVTGEPVTSGTAPSEPVTIDLRVGADVRAYSARHIA